MIHWHTEYFLSGLGSEAMIFWLFSFIFCHLTAELEQLPQHGYLKTQIVDKTAIWGNDKLKNETQHQQIHPSVYKVDASYLANCPILA